MYSSNFCKILNIMFLYNQRCIPTNFLLNLELIEKRIYFVCGVSVVQLEGHKKKVMNNPQFYAQQN